MECSFPQVATQSDYKFFLCLVSRVQVITSVDADKFGEWKKELFDPVEFFIEMLRAIDGVSQIETQTYTVS